MNSTRHCVRNIVRAPNALRSHMISVLTWVHASHHIMPPDVTLRLTHTCANIDTSLRPGLVLPPCRSPCPTISRIVASAIADCAFRVLLSLLRCSHQHCAPQRMRFRRVNLAFGSPVKLGLSPFTTSLNRCQYPSHPHRSRPTLPYRYTCIISVFPLPCLLRITYGHVGRTDSHDYARDINERHSFTSTCRLVSGYCIHLNSHDPPSIFSTRTIFALPRITSDLNCRCANPTPFRTDPSLQLDFVRFDAPRP